MTRAGILDAEQGTTTPRRGTTERPSKRTYVLFLLLAVIVGIGVRAIFVIGDHASSPDETTYLTSGLNWWAGHGFTTISGAPEIHFPPGVPFLIGAVNQVIGADPHTSTNIATILTSALAILPLAGIARLIARRRAALLTAAIAVFVPALTVLPLNSGGSAGPFTLLVLTSTWLALRSWTWSPRGALLASIASGFGVGLAYLTRPEGLFYALVLLPVLVLPTLGGWRGVRKAGGGAWKRAARLTGAFLVPLILCVAPYVQYLHSQTGTWELTAKTRDVSIASWRAVANENRPLRQAILYKPVGKSFEFPTTHSLISLVRGDPGGYLGIVGVNLNRLYSEMFDSSITPYPHWALVPALLFLLAIFAAWRRRRDRVVLAVLAAMTVPVISALAFLMQARYLVPSAALACALVAVGLLELPTKWFRVAVVGTFLLLLTSTGASLFSTTDGWFHPSQGYAEHETIGTWIGAHSQPGDLVMSTTTIPGFYAHRATVPIPYARQSRVIDFARHYGVRYLIVDQASATRFRPQLKPLAYNNHWRTLRAVYKLREDGRRAVVYEIVPRPPRHTGHVPLLGQIGDSS